MKGLPQPLDRQQMGQAGERHLRFPSCHLLHPKKFRRVVCPPRSAVPLSLLQVPGSVLPFAPPARPSFAGFLATMEESESHRPLTPGRSGLPLHPGARVAAVADGLLLFRPLPRSLDVSPCPRKVRPARRFARPMLPTSPGETLGTFDVKIFGVYPHTSFSFLSTLRTRHC